MLGVLWICALSLLVVVILTACAQA